MKKVTSVFLVVAILLLMLPANTWASEPTFGELDPGLVLKVENQQIYNNNYTNLNDKVDALKVLDEGTIIVRFRYSGSTIMSLFSLSNNTLPDGHFHLYISPSSIGSENRYSEPGKPKVNTHIKTDTIVLKEKEVHTVAMVMDKAQGYKYFLDGKLIKQDTTSPRKFLSNIYAPNSAQLGRTERTAGSNQYLFNGDIDFAEVYGKPLADQALIDITGVTKAEPVVNPMPEGAQITAPMNIFYPGFMGSNNYRIPALLYTKKGTLIAGIDRRVPNGGDSPNNIDAVARRSFDQGRTWEANGIVINDYPDLASNIDQELLQDQDTGRIFSLVDGFPHGGGLMGGFGTNAYKGTGFRTIDGRKYMFLTDVLGQEYTIREGGKVYDAAGILTDYTVDLRRNLYKRGVKIDNVFSQNSPLKAYKTSYLELYYSDDEGATWTGPIDLNDKVKEDWMIFLGTGPGSGIQLTQGPDKGRLVFPIYFLNDNNKQASAVIYSDDHGLTWHRGESPNEGRDVGGGVIIHEKDFTSSSHEITESQVVEMPDGQLKLFMRNYSGYAQIATSFDGGETWDAQVATESALVAAYCQMTAIRYNGLIDGKQAVIFASPGNSSSRINGTVKAGLISESGTYPNGRTKYTFDWKYSQLVKEGTYAYSSLANLENGDIGLFYEGTGSTDMSFIRFNIGYLKWQRQGVKPTPKLTSIAIEAPKPEGYAAGDKLQIKAVFDSYVMLSGNRSLTGTIGGKDVILQLVWHNKAGTEFVFEGQFPELDAGLYPLEAAFAPNLNIYNAYGNALSTQTEENKLTDTVKAAAKIVPVTGVQAAPKDVLLKAAGELQLSAVVFPESATNKAVTWTSSDPEVAAIDQAGKVKAVGDGTATVIVTTKDGGFQDTVNVVVDTTAPVIIPTVSLTVYQTETTYIRFDISDALSGVARFAIELDGAEIRNSAEIDPLSLSVGEHMVRVIAADGAGNEIRKEYVLSVMIDADHLDEVLRIGRAKGWIDNQGILQSLLSKVEQVQKRQGDSKRQLSAWNALESETRSQSGKHVSAAFAQLLLDDIAYLQSGITK